VVREKGLVQRFLREVVKDNGLAGYGEKEVRALLLQGAVDTVLVSEDVESYRVKVRCTGCGREEESTTRDMKGFEKKIDATQCRECGNSLEIADYQSTLDELTEMAEATGARIEVISSETEEGQQLKAFGGIAAILRYRP